MNEAKRRKQIGRDIFFVLLDSYRAHLRLGMDLVRQERIIHWGLGLPGVPARFEKLVRRVRKNTRMESVV